MGARMSLHAPAPFRLDHLYFVPDPVEGETAFHADGEFVGEFELDEIMGGYRARKVTFFGGYFDWRPMRRASEARAFLISKIRQ